MTFMLDAVNLEHFRAVARLDLVIISAFAFICYLGPFGGGWRNGRNWRLLTMVSSTLLVMLAMGLLAEAATPWRVVTEGDLDQVRYVVLKFDPATGAPGSYPATIIYFSNGRVILMSGDQSIPFPKGMHVRILKKNGIYKIEGRNGAMKMALVFLFIPRRA